MLFATGEVPEEVGQINIALFRHPGCQVCQSHPKLEHFNIAICNISYGDKLYPEADFGLLQGALGTIILV